VSEKKGKDGSSGGEGGNEKERGGKGARGREDELLEEIQELQQRIASLEEMFAQVMRPLTGMRETAQGYHRLLRLYLRFGRISPDTLVPGLRDDIGREILQVLFERDGQNISQITDAVKERRGTSSRRIVRDRLADLEAREVVERRRRGKIDHFHITEEMVRKWSRMLGLEK
jgi:hypothetical protein